MIFRRSTIIMAVVTLGLIMATLLVQQAQQAKSAQDTHSSLLTEHVEMGPAALNVQDLPLQTQFYRDVVGLEILEQNPEDVLLGWKARPVLHLYASSLPEFSRTSAGLYHTAIVFASRGELAQAVQRVLQQRPELFSGTSDHIVSEAFYFSDPEGNGLELYFDKDPSGWVWRNGQVQMGSSYIDPQLYIATFLDESGSADRKMGHMHLQVGNIAQAKKFYVDVLGLSITSEMPTALFVSDGKYHHHIGMNTWESAGAGERTESLGLRSFELWVATDSDLQQLGQRLEQANWKYELQNDAVLIKDPWGNQIVVSVMP